MARKPVVVAVGGNALITDKDKISTSDQDDAVASTSKSIANLVEAGYTPIVTHGNGPQVGFLLRRVELSLDELPGIPLDVLGADTQGATGYMFVRHLSEELANAGADNRVAALVTQSVVDADDPAFQNPTKPIGSFMDEAEAMSRKENDGWVVVEDAGRGWRRVVASPTPTEIVEGDAIKLLVDAGYVVVAAGGGGIPVRREGNKLIGVEAVIDKDLASAMLATQLDVKDLVICTAIDQVAINFNTPEQENLDTITVEEAKKYLDEGQFGVGSMEPKVQAAVDFIEAGGERVIITSLEMMESALNGEGGTTITA